MTLDAIVLATLHKIAERTDKPLLVEQTMIQIAKEAIATRPPGF